MIVPDINLLVYAHNEDAPFHPLARSWWQDLTNGSEQIGIPWIVASGFVRTITLRSVTPNPLPATVAVDWLSEWFELPHISAINPGREHLALFRRNLDAAGVGGNLVTDAHIAAIAMEYQAEVHSNDSDFARFPGLRWHNPL